MNLDLNVLGSRTIHFNTVADVEDEGAADAGSHTGRQGRMMRLATLLNLDSRLSVRLISYFLTGSTHF